MRKKYEIRLWTQRVGYEENSISNDDEVEGKAPRDVWTMATLDRAYIEAAG